MPFPMPLYAELSPANRCRQRFDAHCSLVYISSNLQSLDVAGANEGTEDHASAESYHSLPMVQK